jgi:hypothetical protein
VKRLSYSEINQNLRTFEIICFVLGISMCILLPYEKKLGFPEWESFSDKLILAHSFLKNPSEK